MPFRWVCSNVALANIWWPFDRADRRTSKISWSQQEWPFQAQLLQVRMRMLSLTVNCLTLVERFIQNSSNPSSQKNLDVRLYNCRTVQGATFNMRGQLYHRHANAMALSSSLAVSALGSVLDEQGLSLRLLRDNSLLPITIPSGLLLQKKYDCPINCCLLFSPFLT